MKKFYTFLAAGAVALTTWAVGSRLVASEANASLSAMFEQVKARTAAVDRVDVKAATGVATVSEFAQMQTLAPAPQKAPQKAVTAEEVYGEYAVTQSYSPFSSTSIGSTITVSAGDTDGSVNLLGLWGSRVVPATLDTEAATITIVKTQIGQVNDSQAGLLDLFVTPCHWNDEGNGVVMTESVVLNYANGKITQADNEDIILFTNENGGMYAGSYGNIWTKEDPNAWTSLGTGRWYEKIMDYFTNFNSGMYWDVEVFQNVNTPTVYRFQPYIGENAVTAALGQDPVWVTLDATDPEKIYIMTYKVGSYEVRQRCPEDNFAEPYFYGTLTDGVLSYAPESFCINSNGSWRVTNKDGGPLLLLPGAEPPADYSVKVDVSDYCTPVADMAATVTFGADVTTAKYFVNPGLIEELDADMAAQVGELGTEWTGITAGAENTLPLNFTADGIYTVCVVTYDAAGAVAGYGCNYTVVNLNPTEGWKKVGTATFTDNTMSGAFSAISASEITAELQQCEAEPGRYRLVNPYASITYFEPEATHTGDHYLYINATDPTKVYVEPSVVANDYFYHGLALWSTICYWTEGLGYDFDLVNGILGYDYGTMTDNVISFPADAFTLSIKSSDYWITPTAEAFTMTFTLDPVEPQDETLVAPVTFDEGTTSLPAGYVIVDNDHITATTVYAATSGASNYAYPGDYEFAQWVQLRVDKDPTADVPTGTEKADCTPVKIDVKQAVTLSSYVRTGANKEVCLFKDGVKVEGTIDGIEDGSNKRFANTWTVEPGTYYLTERGGTGRLSGFVTVKKAGEVPPVVEPKEAEIAWSVESMEYQMGTEFTAPTLTGAENYTVVYASDNTAVATVSDDGVIAIVGPGVAVISATVAADEAAGILETVKTVTITVTEAPATEETRKAAVWFTNGLEMIEPGTVLADNEYFTATTVYATKAGVSKYAYTDDVTFYKWVQLRVDKDPKPETPEGTEKAESTPVKLEVKKATTITTYVRTGTNKTVNLFKDGVLVEGTVTSIVDPNSSSNSLFANTWTVEPGTYYVTERGGTGRISGFTYTAMSNVPVTPTAAQIVWSKDKVTYEQGGEAEFVSPELFGAADYTVAYTSADEAIATVSAEGVIAVTGALGTAVVNASVDADEAAGILPATASVEITVTEYSGITDIIAGELDGDCTFYNLNGVRVANPGKGLYICVKDGKALKVIIK